MSSTITKRWSTELSIVVGAVILLMLPLLAIAIARGLVHDPEVVLLDEPFTGLDRRSAERLAQRLRELHREGRTVVLVTHDLERAMQSADAALVLSRGRVALSTRGGAETAAELERAYLAASDANR